MHTCTNTHIHTCTDKHTQYTHTHIQADGHGETHTHTHTCTHTHAHTCARTHTRGSYLSGQTSRVLRDLPGGAAGFRSKKASVGRFSNQCDAVARRGAGARAFLVVGVDVDVGKHPVEHPLGRIDDPVRHLQGGSRCVEGGLKVGYVG